MLLSFPIGFHDLALQSYLISIESIYLTPYVYLGLFTLFLLVAYRRYNGALAVAENANVHLAERLKAQEAELAQAHERLLAVEREQTLMQERQRLMREMHDGVGSSRPARAALAGRAGCAACAAHPAGGADQHHQAQRRARDHGAHGPGAAWESGRRAGDGSG
jgi:hypothetical protein